MQKQNASTFLLRYMHWPLCQFFCEQRKYIFACSNCLNVNANTGGCSKMANVPFSICLHLYLHKQIKTQPFIAAVLHVFYVFCRLFAREDANHQVCIAGLTERHVHNVEELMEV